MALFQRIIVPVDFTSCSRKALELGMDLARFHGATLTVTHTVEVPVYGYMNQEFPALDVLTPLLEAAKAELARLMRDVKRRIPAARSSLKYGTPYQEILAALDETSADLVVMGTHGRRGLAHLFLGSVAEHVLRLSPVPVLTVRGE